ncbi:unnamed protein product, partial [Sphacelaria rigidula]
QIHHTFLFEHETISSGFYRRGLSFFSKTPLEQGMPLLRSSFVQIEAQICAQVHNTGILEVVVCPKCLQCCRRDAPRQHLHTKPRKNTHTHTPLARIGSNANLFLIHTRQPLFDVNPSCIG